MIIKLIDSDKKVTEYFPEKNFKYKKTLLPTPKPKQTTKILQTSKGEEEMKQLIEMLKSTNDDLTKEIDEYKVINIGSSLKFCLIANGEIDIYPRLGPTSEWDIGAAQCIVEQAGGSVLEHDTKSRLRYNKENILNPFFIVST